MGLEKSVLERVRRYTDLSRWERSELGRDLRRGGLSYGEIMELIPVKKSTLATWCRDIELTNYQIAAIKKRRAPEPGSRDTQWKRREAIAQIRRDARIEARQLMVDPVWVAGVILYWGEGGKSRNDFKLANSDPRALRLFISWVRNYLDSAAGFSLHLHLHEGNDEEAARSFWRQQTGLADANFFKTFIKPAGTGHRKNHLEHGVCTVVVRRSANHWQRTMIWIEELADGLGLGYSSQ